MQVSLQLHGVQVPHEQGVQVVGGHSQVHGSQVQGVQEQGVQEQGVQLSQQLLQPQLQFCPQSQVPSSVSPRTANRLESARIKFDEHLPDARYE